jgi:diguanylate cyclase (GGDEF)-like protein
MSKRCWDVTRREGDLVLNENKRTNNQRKVSLVALLCGLVFLTIILTSVVYSVVSYQTQRNTTFHSALESNYANAQKMGHTMSTLFVTMRTSLHKSAEYMSTHLTLSDYEIQTQLDLMQSSNYFNSLLYVNELGLVRRVSPESIGIAGNFLTSEEPKIALQVQKPYVSKPYISATNRLMVMISEPIFDAAGIYKGMIAGTIYLHDANVLSTIFGDNELTKSGSYFYVVGPTGNLLYHPQESRLGENVSSNPVVNKLLHGQSGQEYVVNTMGVSHLAGYVNVPTNGWGVVVQTPVEEINGQLRKQYSRQIYYLIVPLLIMLIGAVWLANKLALPFVNLSNVAMQLSSGQKVDSIPTTSHWNREADYLYKSLWLAIHILQEQSERANLEAKTDPLTGIMNRRSLKEITNQWVFQQQTFSIILLDIDRFKTINDQFGHQAGDEVLKHLVKVVGSVIRPEDMCCRLGGEEFVVLLPDSSEELAYLAAERIRISIEASSTPIVQSITVSLGVAVYPMQADSVDELLELADKAMYQAKNDGRNRTVLSSSL